MKIRYLTWIPLALFLLMVANVRAAEPESSPKMEPRAEEVLKRCADFYSGLRQMHCEISFRMFVQATGTRREIWAGYDVDLERPNKAALRLKDGVGATIVSNGRKMTTYLPATQRFTTKEAPATLDQFFSSEDVALINRSLGELLFLGKLIKADPLAALTEDARQVSYKGIDDFDGQKMHHLKFDRGDVNLDVWIDAGDKPFLRRISPDITPALLAQLDGGKGAKMDLTVKYGDWSTEPLPPDAFAFQPPQGAEEVASLFDDDGGNADADVKNKLVGKPLPDTRLTMLDGSKVDLKELEGKKVVVLDFWATWCAPCLHALPMTAEVAKDFAARDVAFYTVNFSEAPEKIREFMEKNDFGLKVAVDQKGELAKLLEIRGIPFTLVIGKDGKVLAVHSGLQPNYKEMLTKDLEAALAHGSEPVPTSAEKQAR